MKNIFLTLALTAGIMASAQVKIGDNVTTLNANSLLELESTSKGVLFPRVTLTGTTDATTVGTQVAGMTVYNTAATSDVTEGMYTSNGTIWVKLGSSSSFTSATYTKTLDYTTLNTAEVTPNNITSYTFTTAPVGLALSNLPSGTSNVGKVVNIFNSAATPISVSFSKAGNGIAGSNTIQGGRGTSFVWDGIGWSRNSY